MQTINLASLIASINKEEEDREMVMELVLGYENHPDLRFVQKPLSKLAFALDELGRPDFALWRGERAGLELLPEELESIVAWRNTIYQEQIYPVIDQLRRAHG